MVDEAITSRRSIRAFLPTPLPREVVEQILAIAARAPSGTNTQPWRVYVLTGAAKQRLSEAIIGRLRRPGAVAGTHRGVRLLPDASGSTLTSTRRRKIGWDLYGLLGIGQTDKDRMHAQHGRNYVFFDAPVGLMFTIDRDLETG